MYEGNIYIKNAAKVQSYSGDIGVQLDKFENDNNIKKDALARAQYKHWLSKVKGVYVPLSVDERNMLGL